MKGKVARNLRKIVNQHFPDAEMVSYQDLEHTQKMIVVGVNADGTPRYEIVTPKTRLLAPSCKRKLYKKAKRAHKQAVQAL